MAPDMVDGVDLADVEVVARGAVGDDGVVLPAVPQLGDHVDELLGAPVALLVAGRLVEPEVVRGVLAERRHDVPPRAAVRDAVEAREQAGEVVGS